jgi:hypothetical protein
MPLFRELNEGQQAKIEKDLVRREGLIGELSIDLGRRTSILLFIALLSGVAADFFLAVHQTPVRPSLLASLVCFLVGLLVFGVQLALSGRFLWRLSYRLSGLKASILASQTDTAVLNMPAAPTRFDNAMFAIGYAAFTAWILGWALGTYSLVAHQSTYDAQRIHREASTTGPTTVTPEQERVEPPRQDASAEEASRTYPSSAVRAANKGSRPWFEGWNFSDQIAFWAVVAALVQAAALILTFRLQRFTIRRQLRAYVFPETFDLYDGALSKPPNPQVANEPACVLILKNSGQTPAYKVVSFAKIELVEPINEDRLVTTPLLDKFSANLGPGTQIRNSPRFGRQLTQNEIADINNGTKGLYLFGRIDYRDIFWRKRFTTFRLRYLGTYPPSEPANLNFCERGNEVDRQ